MYINIYIYIIILASLTMIRPQLEALIENHRLKHSAIACTSKNKHEM